MIKKSEVLIEVKKYRVSHVIRILSRNNISFKNLEIKEDVISFIIDVKDLKKTKGLFSKKNINIVKYYGLLGIKSFIKKHYIFLLSIILGIILIYILSNIIFSIEVITKNKELKEEILTTLEESGISKYKFIKSNKEINAIKEKILLDNKDKLEWLEIDVDGTKVTIELTERIIREEDINIDTPTNIVSTKDALILYVVCEKGTVIKYVNDYVHEGEIIITGNILKNDEIVASHESVGRVYGEVWYTVDTTVPYNFVEYYPTGEVINHYYADIFGKKMTILGKYDTDKSINTKRVLIDKPYLFFKVIKEEKKIYDYVTMDLTKEEAYAEALKRSKRSIEAKLESDEVILDEIVLNTEYFKDRISIKTFYKVYENIGKSVVIGEEESIQIETPNFEELY